MTLRNWEIYKRRVRDELTYREIGLEFNISNERVRQIINLWDRCLEVYETNGTMRLKCRGKLD